MSIPPILGTSPLCDMRLLGLTTKCRTLAIFITTGIHIKPIVNENMAIKMG